MLLHLTPRCFGPLNRHTAELLSYAVDELGVEYETWKRQGPLITGKPYPNRCYSVGRKMNNSGRADSGLLFEVDPRLRFTTRARWGITVGGRSWEAEHVVIYFLMDHDLDAATDNMVLWHGWAGASGEVSWQSRWPDMVAGPPCNAMPRFDVYGGSTKSGDVVDTPHGEAVPGAIARREERFYMPTVERARLLGKRKLHRIPHLDQALPCGSYQAPIAPAFPGA